MPVHLSALWSVQQVIQCNHLKMHRLTIKKNSLSFFCLSNLSALTALPLDNTYAVFKWLILSEPSVGGVQV